MMRARALHNKKRGGSPPFFCVCHLGRDCLAIRALFAFKTCPLAPQYVPSLRSIRVLLMLNRCRIGGVGWRCWTRVGEVVFAEVLASCWQLVVLECGQYILELAEEATAWGVVVGTHVEGKACPKPLPKGREHRWRAVE